MTSILTIVLSYRKLAPKAPLPAPGTEDTQPLALDRMTINFRLSFWRMFQKAWRIPFATHKLVIFDLPAQISDVHLFEARTSKQEPGSYLLVACLRFGADIDALRAARGASRDQLNSQELVRIFEAALSDTPAAPILNALSAEVVGCSSTAADLTETGAAHIPYLAAFHHYGWLISLRIDREMLRLDLSPGEAAYKSNAQTIIRHRILLIQLQRTVLNEDRTNNEELKDICKTLRAKYKLEQRFQRLSSLNRSMEEHLDNTFKVMQSNATRTTNAIIRLLTFSAIPLGVLSVLLAINLSSSVFAELDDVLASARLQVMLLFSFAVPFVLIGAAMLIDRFGVGRDSK